MKKILLFFTFLSTILLSINYEINAQITSPSLGNETDSSSGRGPFQRSSSSSSSVFSRANLVYTAAELSSIGIEAGTEISQINWDLGSTNIITATGNATLTVYMKNSSSTAAANDSWANIISGATQVGAYTFNTTNNFPGAEGFMDFVLAQNFTYTGGTLEIAVDWDCSNLIPADAGQPNLLFSGNGSLNWHWSPTTHVSSVDQSGSSSAPSNVSSSPLSERVNTQFVYTPAPGSTQTITIGDETDSSSGRGPFQRSSSSSSSVFSRANLVYTPAELVGFTSGTEISQISWDLGSTNMITAAGDATLIIYMKNSSSTAAVNDSWANIISGATQVGTYTFNTANNFPGAEGFMDFALAQNFTYTGGSIEIAVDWDCSNLIPADAGQPNLLFSGNGSLNWHWSPTTHVSSVDQSGSSSAPSNVSSSPLSERVNTQFVFTLPASCDVPSNLNATNITPTSADVSWDAASGASTYNWIIVETGAGADATAIASGATASLTASVTGLPSCITSYDLHVQTDCGGGSLSAFSAAYNFSTESVSILTSQSLGNETNSSSGRGPFQRSDSGSSSVFSRANLVYTATELASIGIEAGTDIAQINWDLGSSNIITATGDATLIIYMKNSSSTAAVNDSWDNIISGSTQVGTYTFNTSNNFPGEEGFMNFALAQNFTYTGGSIEIAVDWDCSNLIPADANEPNLLFSGNGSLNWHWSDTDHVSSVDQSGSSSAPSNVSSSPLSERVNTQFLFTPAPGSTHTTTIGAGTSSSATRGPFQRSDSGSGSVHSRGNMVYTQSEVLTTLGISSGSTISQINWDLGSTNVITASGDATMNIYMKNSSVSAATEDTWANTISGHTLVGTYTFNTTNNFPGAEGFMDFLLDTDFVYTGNSIEIAVEWDCSNLIPADTGQPNLLFSGNGSLNWHWSATTHNSLIYRAGSSSPPSDLTGGNLKAERVNTQFVFTTPSPMSSLTVPADTTVCAGISVPTQSFTSTITGTTFDWTSDTDIGFGTSGTGDIDSFTAANPDTAAAVATIIVTPTANTCVGIADTFTITVKPLPIAMVPADTTICAGASVPTQSFTSTTSDVLFVWTSDNDIGIDISGADSIPAFVATNTDTAAVMTTVSVFPSANGCVGPTETFTITVDPLPSVAAITNISVDAGATVTVPNFSGSAGATFDWLNDNTNIGLVEDGSGNIASFTATNTTNAAISATISVTPSLNGCVGATQTFTITVNPVVVTTLCQVIDLMIASVNDGDNNVASNTITSDATIPATFQVTYQAGQSITLQPGFHAEANSNFLAKIAPCILSLESPDEEEAIARNTFIGNNPIAKSELTMQVQPNPARSSIEINYSLGATSTTSIALYDLTGKALKMLLSNQVQEQGLYKQEVDITDLNAGIYFVLLENEGQVLTQKLIVVE